MDTFTRNARAAVAVAALGLVLLRLLGGDLGARVDSTVVFLLGGIALVLLVPWEQLQSFRGGGIEITIDRPEVKAAIGSMAFEGGGRLDNERLLATVRRLGDSVESARGGRVLWIDDNPHEILGVRRVLRALGVDVTTATSSERALSILEADNDFDLIVSDVQRAGESYRYNDGRKVHEGVNFVCRLRDHPDRNIAGMEVVFYAGYDWDRLVTFTRPARERQPEAQIANAADDLVEKAIRTLARVREDPVEYSVRKKATPYRSRRPGAPTPDGDGPRPDGETTDPR